MNQMLKIEATESIVAGNVWVSAAPVSTSFHRNSRDFLGAVCCWTGTGNYQILQNYPSVSLKFIVRIYLESPQIQHGMHL